MVLLDLGEPGLLLGLELEPLDLLPGLADAHAGGVHGAVGLLLGVLGVEDALAGLDDGRVHLDAVAVAEGAVQQGRLAARAAGGAAGGGVVRGRAAVARVARRAGPHRRRGGHGALAAAAEEPVALVLFGERRGLLDDLVLGFAAGEERHFLWMWIGRGVCGKVI